ncbi:MAG: helix-turn-helix transcriptional regulator [Syntrophomonadaceae bacterium]|nr:helix-turn-helix transcriptional regulator [Syntrophomonadaceae bacterium]
MIANGAVGILVVCLAIGLQLVSKYSIWNMCNLFFIAMICTYGLYFMPEGSLLRSLALRIHGFEQIGYIAAYYLLGCVFKKYGDFRIFKLSLVTILPISMVSYMIPGAISLYAPANLPLVATLVSLIVFIVFILLSPAYSKHLFAAGWADDFYGVDMIEDAQDVQFLDKLKAFNFTSREVEVASLLLSGKNTKQIALMLDISTHTVNFHIKNIYKKLDINSRAELFARLT